MDPRTLARLHGAARLAVGAAYVAAPGLAARTWIGADGSRESVGVLADAADLVATLRARDSLPAPRVLGVALIAGGSVAIGAWLDRALD